MGWKNANFFDGLSVTSGSPGLAPGVGEKSAMMQNRGRMRSVKG